MSVAAVVGSNQGTISYGVGGYRLTLQGNERQFLPEFRLTSSRQEMMLGPVRLSDGGVATKIGHSLEINSYIIST